MLSKAQLKPHKQVKISKECANLKFQVLSKFVQKFSYCSSCMQQFEEILIAEEFAQAKYYEARHQLTGSSRPFIEPRLQPSPQPLHYPPNCSPVPPNYSPAPPPMQRFAPDNISIKSAPTLTRSTSGSHVCASPPTARPRAKKWPRGHAHYRLSSSASTSSLSSTTSTISRPKSYVPFEESFDTHIASVHGWAGLAGGRGRQAPPTGSHPPPSGSHGVR